MKKMKVGMIGAGFMGKAHVVAYTTMPKLFWPAPAVPVLKTVCDIEPEIAMPRSPSQLSKRASMCYVKNPLPPHPRTPRPWWRRLRRPPKMA